MFPNQHKVKLKNLLATHMSTNQSDGVSPPSVAWISSVEECAEKVEARTMWTSVAIIAFSLVGLMWSAQVDLDTFNSLAFGALVLTYGLGIAMYVGVTCSRADYAQRLVKKLSTTEDCPNALMLIEQFDACRAYHDAVHAQGREFIVADYLLLREIAKAHPGYTNGYEASAYCKKLHGVIGTTA